MLMSPMAMSAAYIVADSVAFSCDMLSGLADVLQVSTVAATRYSEHSAGGPAGTKRAFLMHLPVLACFPFKGVCRVLCLISLGYGVTGAWSRSCALLRGGVRARPHALAADGGLMQVVLDEKRPAAIQRRVGNQLRAIAARDGIVQGCRYLLLAPVWRLTRPVLEYVARLRLC